MKTPAEIRQSLHSAIDSIPPETLQADRAIKLRIRPDGSVQVNFSFRFEPRPAE